MRKYLSFFRLRFSMGLQYRTAAVAGIVTQFFWGFMEIMVFRAFYEAEPERFPMTFEAMVSYVWMQQAFLAFFAVWMLNGEIYNTILEGNIAYELCRPIKIYDMWFSKETANRMARAVLRCFPILLVAMFLPKPFRLLPPASLMHFILFLFTLMMGLGVTVAFCMMIYIMAFFTISPSGLCMLFTSITEFFAGAIIPLPFFPEKIRYAMELLPFASMQNVALRIYSGNMSSVEMTRAIFLQAFWLITLIVGGRLLCNVAEQRVTIQGG